MLVILSKHPYIVGWSAKTHLKKHVIRCCVQIRFLKQHRFQWLDWKNSAVRNSKKTHESFFTMFSLDINRTFALSWNYYTDGKPFHKFAICIVNAMYRLALKSVRFSKSKPAALSHRIICLISTEQLKKLPNTKIWWECQKSWSIRSLLDACCVTHFNYQELSLYSWLGTTM